MREIKFRAWYPEDDSHDGYMVQVDRLNRPYIKNEFDKNHWEINSEIDTKEDCAILMQYTGLKDKNDKEIYEGDIIQTIYHTGKYLCRSKPRVVEWTGFIQLIGFNLGLGRKLTGAIYEVIGDIYQNPELLV